MASRATRNKATSLLTAVIVAFWFGARCPPVSNLSAAQTALGQSLSAPAEDELRTLVAEGNLADLRWPNFIDLRDRVFTFYQAGAFSLAWIRDNGVTPQARVMIQLFETASQRGLVAEDYDGPAGRLGSGKYG